MAICSAGDFPPHHGRRDKYWMTLIGRNPPMALSENVVPQNGGNIYGNIMINKWIMDDYGTYGTWDGKMMNRFFLGFYILFGQNHIEISVSFNAVVFLPKGRDGRCPILFIANTIHLTYERSEMPNRARRCKSKWFHVVSTVSRTRLSRVFFPTQAMTVDKASNFSGKPTPTVTVSKRYKYACEPGARGSPGSSGHVPHVSNVSHVFSLGSDPGVISLMPESRQASEIVAHEGGFNLCKNGADSVFSCFCSSPQTWEANLDLRPGPL